MENKVSFRLKRFQKRFSRKDKYIIQDSYGKSSVTVYKSTSVNKCVLCGYNLLYHNVYLQNCYLGYGTYVNSGTNLFSTYVGAYSSVSSNVRIINGIHPSSFVTTYPGFYSNAHNGIKTYSDKVYFKEYAEKKYDGYSTYIGNDVLICTGAVITEGVHIGDGAIILPYAVVSKDVEPYAVVGGIPAKVSKYRFDDDNIMYLLDLKWWNKSPEWLQKNWKRMMDIEELKKSNVNKD